MSATNLILSSLWLTPPPKLRGSVHLALTSSMSPSSRRASQSSVGIGITELLPEPVIRWDSLKTASFLKILIRAVVPGLNPVEAMPQRA